VAGQEYHYPYQISSPLLAQPQKLQVHSSRSALFKAWSKNQSVMAYHSDGSHLIGKYRICAIQLSRFSYKQRFSAFSYRIIPKLKTCPSPYRQRKTSIHSLFTKLFQKIFDSQHFLANGWLAHFFQLRNLCYRISFNRPQS